MAVRNAPPHASSMLESLRGLGYAIPTALADLVDNSIAASAGEVVIHLEWAGPESWIRIVDDGEGMDDAALEAGMRLGARDPRIERAAFDLGRFGLGLKTASFSQARRLTVASRRAGGPVVCLRWDLDLIGTEPDADWPLFEGPAPGSEHLLEPLGQMKHGTIVLWEKLDRIVTDGFVASDMIELADRVDAHLAMVFHRLLDGQTSALRLILNSRAIRPWDPYLMGHPGKALESPEYRILHTTGVTVQCHVLPHRDMLKTNEQEAAATHGKPVHGFDQAALSFLEGYDWPGNLRELSNEVIRMLIRAQEPILGADLISRPILQAPPGEGGADRSAQAALTGEGSLKDRVEMVEMRILRETLTRHRWNKSRAAAELGLSRVGLRAKLDRYGVQRPGQAMADEEEDD